MVVISILDVQSSHPKKEEKQMRGSYNPSLMKDTQIRKWFNDEGVQVTKDALQELHRYIENHMKVVWTQVKKKSIVRLTYNDVAQILSEQWSTQN